MLLSIYQLFKKKTNLIFVDRDILVFDIFNYSFLIEIEVIMNILIIGFSDLDKDARISRQVSWLKNNHNLSIICLNSSKIDNVEIHKVANTYKTIKKFRDIFLLKFRLYMKYYFSLAEIKQSCKYLEDKVFDLIIANDIQSLPLAVKYKKSAKIFFDAHEFAPREHDSNKFWCFFFKNYYTFLCERFIPKADAMTTVSYHIAEEYEKMFKNKVDLLLNLPNLYNMNNPLFNKEPNYSFVHHGVALPQRKMELMISAFEKLGNNYYLDMYLVPTNYKYYLFLKKRCEGLQNVRINDALPINEIISTLTHYDAGIFLLPSDSFNYIYCLPNKLFDFIQARLAVVIGPSPEMKRIVEEYECGYVTKDFELDNIVNEIKQISRDDIQRYKENAHKAAFELNAEKSKEVFLKIINKLVNNKSNELN